MSIAFEEVMLDGGPHGKGSRTANVQGLLLERQHLHNTLPRLCHKVVAQFATWAVVRPEMYNVRAPLMPMPHLFEQAAKSMPPALRRASIAVASDSRCLSSSASSAS